MSTQPRSDPSDEVPEGIQHALNNEASFRVLTMDGVGWIDPYTGTVVPAPFGHADVARKHLARSRPWHSMKPKSLKELLYLRWRHYLRQHLEFSEHLRVFQHGFWLNPYTGDWVKDVTLINNQISPETVDDIARVLGACVEAQSGKMLEKFRLDILIANGPGTHLLRKQTTVPALSTRTGASDRAVIATARAAKERADRTADTRILTERTAARSALAPKVESARLRRPGKNITDFLHVKTQFLRMLGKPPRIDGYQMVMHYEPYSAIPRTFYDFISLDRHRVLLVVGELMGDGPGAALMVAQAMRSMRRLASSRTDLIDLVASLNDEVRVDLVAGCSVAFFAAVVNIPSQSLTCLSVGFHPALLINAHRDITLQQIHTGGEPLGVCAGQKFRSSLKPTSIQLEPGDVIVMYTDGLAVGHSHHDVAAGRLAVMGSAVAHLDLPMGQMLSHMVDDSRRGFGGRPTHDLAVLGMRVKHRDETSGGQTVV